MFHTEVQTHGRADAADAADADAEDAEDDAAAGVGEDGAEGRAGGAGGRRAAGGGPEAVCRLVGALLRSKYPAISEVCVCLCV